MDVSVPMEVIKGKIYMIRGQKVLLDSDLADLYGIETKNLNKAVKRNLSRFPQDFMFQLTSDESTGLRFQIGTSKEAGRGGRRYNPYVFTEQGPHRNKPKRDAHKFISPTGNPPALPGVLKSLTVPGSCNSSLYCCRPSGSVMQSRVLIFTIAERPL